MDVVDQIKAIVGSHPIVLFMKGTPEFPTCGFSDRAVKALEAAGAPYHAVNVLADARIRAGLPHYSNSPTFPQLFLLGEFIGGCDIVEDLHSAGELKRMAADVVEARS